MSHKREQNTRNVVQLKSEQIFRDFTWQLLDGFMICLFLVVMILPRWTPLQCMCSAAWLASVALRCPVGDQTIKMPRDQNAVVKTVPLLHRHIFPPILCTAKLAKATAQGLQVLWVPLLQTSAKDQWMPSCFLPKNTELNTLRCIQGKTTGNDTNCSFVTKLDEIY